MNFLILLFSIISIANLSKDENMNRSPDKSNYQLDDLQKISKFELL